MLDLLALFTGVLAGWWFLLQLSKECRRIARTSGATARRAFATATIAVALLALDGIGQEYNTAIARAQASGGMFFYCGVFASIAAYGITRFFRKS